MSCFICGLVASETHEILETTTSCRGIPLYNVLYDFIGKYFDVEIGSGDVVCETCSALLDAMDRLRFELDNVEYMLQTQITRKYKLNETQVCRLDDRTARHYQKGTQQRFACVECPFETDFADCLLPHRWLHDHQTDFINTLAAADASMLGTYVCHSCKLSFCTDESLEAHSLEFHADEDRSEAINNASPVELDIDDESGNEAGCEHDETAPCSETNDNSVGDMPECDVSP